MQAWTRKQSLPIANAKPLWEKRLMFLIICEHCEQNIEQCGLKLNLFVKVSPVILQT